MSAKIVIAQQGPQGVAGRTVLNGTTNPINSVGKDGDFYLKTTDSTLWGPKAGGVWPSPGTSLVGPQGPEGPSGSVGELSAITTDIAPDTNGGHSVGTSVKAWSSLYLKDTATSDIWQFKVTNGELLIELVGS